LVRAVVYLKEVLGLGKRQDQLLVPENDPDFCRFWDAYPKRVSKKDARIAWKKLAPTPATVDRMLAALAWQCRQAAWLRDGGQFIPYPASWLRAERWDDEPVAVPQLSERSARLAVSGEEFVAEGRYGKH
jgi:hypothetical protein